MADYQQGGRLLTVTTPLGDNKLLLIGLSGTEALSQLFRFHLDLIATNDQNIPFEAILGKPVTAHINSPTGQHRHISGICSRFAQGGRDPFFTSYTAEVVPELWFLTRRAQSRIFQPQTVPAILRKVLQGLKVRYELVGVYEPRDYCVQYRETDFNFVSRLMEEEGIYYYFDHTATALTMVVADSPGGHQAVPFEPTVTFEPIDVSSVQEDRVTEWQKTQDLRSSRFLLWDHTFELPHKKLESQQELTPTAKVGTTTHQLRVGDAASLEVYDWPGEYAQRFDGVGPAREDRPADLGKVPKDGNRTVKLRMEQEATECLNIAGTSRLRQLTAGHKFTLQKHFNADGAYVLTAVHHTARMGANYRSGDVGEVAYSNTFTCLPASVPFRPVRSTPKPVVQGTQTAVVVGAKGEEVYTDKYGRVKVQFHWDREGQHNERSSCWVRVAQMTAGRRWGGSFWPRIGQEVVVDHLEGDPDQPIIIGTVYNADQMPPYLGKAPDPKHKDENLISGVKSNTSKGGTGYNEFRFYDAKDKQQIFIHAERNMDVRVKHDSMEHVVGDRHMIVGKEPNGSEGGDLREDVYKDEHRHIRRHQTEHVEGNLQLTVGHGKGGGGNVDLVVEKTRKELIEGDDHLHVKGTCSEKVDGNHAVTHGGDHTEKVAGKFHMTIGGDQVEKVGGGHSLNVATSQQVKVGQKHAVDAGQEIHLKAGMNLVIEAMKITLKGAGGFITIDPSGVAIQGTLVLINSGGAAGSGTGSSPSDPSPPKAPSAAAQAKPTAPDKADDAVTGQKSSS